jgi:predicted Holliday junction resolvase-like endonuclease
LDLIIVTVALCILFTTVFYYERRIQHSTQVITQRISLLAVQEARKQLEKEFEDYKITFARSSRASIKGKVAEQLYPLSVEFPYNRNDMRFMGDFADYIILDGYSNAKAGEGDVKEIIFLEIKSDSARLSKAQSSVRNAVNNGRVRWETITVRTGSTSPINAISTRTSSNKADNDVGSS